tara:strand:- start:9 stop:1403 length:1395 start_codon:yes stop_codon:yes gene_type:complete
MKFPPAKAEAEVLDLSTKKQVTGKGIDSLKKELGLPEGIDPNSPMGKIISDQNRVSKLGKNIGSKKKSIGDMFVEASKSAARPVNREKEGLVRTAAREFLNREIKLKKLNLNEKELKSIVSPSGSGEDPINVLRKYYGENTLVEFDNLGDKFLNTEKYSDFNKIIDKNVDSSFLKPRKDPNIKESYTDKEMAEIINKMETKEKDLGTKLKDLPDDIDPDAMAQGGIAGQLHLNQGGRVGLKKGGPPNPGRRNFMKLMAGLATLPVFGKFFKGAKVASKVVPLKNTTTTMPAWFPDLVDKFVAKGISKKIDEDLMEYTTKDLPGVKLTKSDDGKIIVEGQNEYSRPYAIEYEPPGYEVIDEVKGKALKTPGDFRATDVVPESGGHPDDIPDFFPEQLDSVDDILSSDARIMEEFATGSKIKNPKRGEQVVGQAEVRAENAADDAAERAAMEADDYAKGGLAGQLL